MPVRRDKLTALADAESVFAQNLISPVDDSTQANWYALLLVIVGGKTKKGSKRDFSVDEALAAMGCLRRTKGDGDE